MNSYKLQGIRVTWDFHPPGAPPRSISSVLVSYHIDWMQSL